MLRCLEHRLTICCRSNSIIIDSTAIYRNPRRFANSAVYKKSRLSGQRIITEVLLFFPPRATCAALRSRSLCTRTPPLERLMSKFFANSRASYCPEFFFAIHADFFFAAISPPGKLESSADSVAQLPRATQVSALLHRMKRPTAEVSLPVDANQKREVWQPLPFAQQSHS